MFATEGMQILDRVLSQMDSNVHNRDLTTLEIVVHEFHMRELWARMLPVYQKIKANPPSNAAAVCKCAMNVQNNGILQTMRISSLKWREPGLMIAPGSKLVQSDVEKCQIRFLSLESRKVYTLKLDPLIDSKEEVCGSQGWVKFIQHLDEDVAATIYDPALFVYCALNHAE